MGFVLIAAAIFGLDFFVKRWMDTNRKLGEESRILGNWIILRKHYNKGAMLNALDRWPWVVRALSGSLLIILCIVFGLMFREQSQKGVKLGLAMVIGGGGSNLLDRMTKGYVVDYFSFRSRWSKLQKVIFNISDLFIFLGSALVLIFHRK